MAAWWFVLAQTTIRPLFPLDQQKHHTYIRPLFPPDLNFTDSCPDATPGRGARTVSIARALRYFKWHPNHLRIRRQDDNGAL